MIDGLSKEEKLALLELMGCLAHADGRIDDIERELLADYAELFNIQLADVTCPCDTKNLDSMVAQFQNPESRVIVLQELLRVAHLDGFFNNDEKSLIMHVATLMGVPPDFLDRIDKWVLDGIEWMIQGEELLDSATTEIRLPPEA